MLNDSMRPYRCGAPLDEWRSGEAWTAQLIVTEDCNLRCSYCYLCNKNGAGRMAFQVAADAIDFILRRFGDKQAVILEFAGGEPLLEIELIDRLTDHFVKMLDKHNHRWGANYRFNLTTNGILYGTPAVQKWIHKHKDEISIGITVDGTQLKHDSTRKKPNGAGSYCDVVKNVPLWLSQYPRASTKVTFSAKCVQYLKESILHLWSLGIVNVVANCCFEDDWTEQHAGVLERQMMDLADAVIEQDLWKEYSCSLFSEDIGVPTRENTNWCGAGKMIAVGHDGTIYPCVRFMPFSLRNKPPIVLGHVKNGIDDDRLRAFQALTRYAQSSRECFNCQVATGCAWCQGFNYDAAGPPTIFERNMNICAMHKARVRANNHYWSRLAQERGVVRQNGLTPRASVANVP